MIHDVAVRRLKRAEGAEAHNLRVYQYADHLLYRVGLVEFVKLEPGGSVGPRLRQGADEVWALLAGSCTFHFYDRRQQSPTRDVRQEHGAVEPTLALVPFGVAFGLRSPDGAQLLRMSTHTEGEQADPVSLSWDEM